MKEEEGVATIHHHRHHAFFLHHNTTTTCCCCCCWREIRLPKPEELSENVLTGHMNSSDVAQPSKNNTIG